jgi:hypothetical protein
MRLSRIQLLQSTWVFLLACASALAQSPSPSSAPGSLATTPAVQVSALATGVAAIHLFRDDGHGKPGVEVARFGHLTDKRVHFRVDFNPPLSGKFEGKWIFTATDTEVGPNEHVGEVPFSADGHDTVESVNGSLEATSLWAPGRYRVILYVGGKPVQVIDYAIARETK